MSVLIVLVVLCVCLAASTVGAICGIGGGVIIKPVLDAMQIMTVQQVSFLSGCTVLCMSAYSVFSSARRDKSSLETATILPLGIGAALGGLAGKLLFQQISRGSSVAALFTYQISAVKGVSPSAGRGLYLLKSGSLCRESS